MDVHRCSDACVTRISFCWTPSTYLSLGRAFSASGEQLAWRITSAVPRAQCADALEGTPCGLSSNDASRSLDCLGPLPGPVLYALVPNLLTLCFRALPSIPGNSFVSQCSTHSHGRSHRFESYSATICFWSGPEAWVTQCTGHMGDTFGPSGFSSGSSTRVSKSNCQRGGERISSP